MVDLYGWRGKSEDTLEEIMRDPEKEAIITRREADLVGSDLGIVFPIVPGIPFPGLTFLTTEDETQFYVSDNSSNEKTFCLTIPSSAPFYQSDKVEEHLHYQGNREQLRADLEAAGFQFNDNLTPFEEIAGPDTEWYRQATAYLEEHSVF